MDRWQAIGADNNARWCDLITRSHGGQGVFGKDAWTSATRTPTLYPDAVTLVASPNVPDLLGRIDFSPGCTIKDSFAALDLSSHGFSVLFAAKWITLPAYSRPSWDVPCDWTRVTDPDNLRRWEEAWSDDSEREELFLPALLSEPSVVVLGRFRHGQIVGGGVVSGSTEIAGISNVFSVSGRESEIWSGLARCAGAYFPNLPLIGYESGEELAHAENSGFQAVGDLQIWIADS
jgi:hypothetical protein